MREIEIGVRDGPEILEHRTCRTLLLPDGRTGALWRGLVYPVGENQDIDIVGEAFPPGECCLVPTAAPDCPAYTWIQGDEEAYLLLTGPVAAREAAAASLRTAGICVLRSGRYLGDPVNGIAADWFVRFEKPPTGESLDALLMRLPRTWSPGPNAIPEIAPEIRLRLLQAELAQARAREARLRSELLNARTVAAQQSASADDETLREAIASEQRLRLEAEGARAEAEAALQAAHGASVPVRPPPPRTRLHNEISIVLEILLPSLNLLRDSLTVAASEYVSRKPLYRALAELAAGDGRLPPNWKAVQGAAAWWERHVSNGQDNTGRIYARFVPHQRGWDLLISDKQEQARDMAWLRRHAAG